MHERGAGVPRLHLVAEDGLYLAWVLNLQDVWVHGAVVLLEELGGELWGEVGRLVWWCERHIL